MTQIGNYHKKENVLKKVDGETGFTVRLHFAENNEGDNLVKEIQKILTEIYIKNLTFKGSE